MEVLLTIMADLLQSVNIRMSPHNYSGTPLIRTLLGPIQASCLVILGVKYCMNGSFGAEKTVPFIEVSLFHSVLIEGFHRNSKVLTTL